MKKVFLSMGIFSFFVGGSVVLLRGRSETKKDSRLIHLEKEEKRLEDDLEKLRAKLSGEGTGTIREHIIEKEEQLRQIEKKKNRLQ